MTEIKKLSYLILSLVLVLSVFAGCNKSELPTTSDVPSVSPSVSPSVTPSEDNELSPDLSQSDNFNEDGFWKDIKATDYVTLGDYKNISIPKNIHQVTDAAINGQIESVLGDYLLTEKVTDSLVELGDTVNIDYIGSIDGVEFEGGNTGGVGTDVTIGETQYIDDFLEQLIGHKPGETLNVEVTFPENYGNESLNGKDALFVVTINYIASLVMPELTDSFVTENLTAQYGWNTVAEMSNDIKAELENSAVSQYLEEYVVEGVKISSLPDAILKFQEDSMISFYTQFAAYNSMTFNDFLASYLGFQTVDQLLEDAKESNTKAANLLLIRQAIAEDAKIAVSEDDLSAYFIDTTSSSDYSQYEAQYGIPYLKMIVLNQKVTTFLIENAIRE